MNISKKSIPRRIIDVGIIGNIFGMQFISLIMLFLHSIKLMNIRSLAYVIFIFLYFSTIALVDLLDGNITNLFSYINAFLTLSVIVILKREDILNFKRYLVDLAILSVPVAIVMSLFLNSYVEDAGIRTSDVFGMSRLTFFFSEPSHYAIFLAFNLINAKSANVGIARLSIISLGLILTWSLSGYLLFSILLAIDKSKGKSFRLIFFSIFIYMSLFLMWKFVLDGSGFWLEKKLDTLLAVLDGERGLSSSSVRYLSTVLFFEYAQYSFGKLSFLFGEGMTGYFLWVENYYSTNYGIYRSGDIFNYFTALFVSGGVIGFLFYLFSMFQIVNYDGMSKVRLSLSAIALSLFSGYVFGFTALLYWLLVFSFSIEEIRAK
ncbi:hypothetical protein [Vibrio navarrensis]|uniref:hypothetical protein n=1 Tax=Vibrio navarrensis TaxID=29495 RepID=UPI00051DACD5|nr:hypothetical protein [Vibrio navarrensis]KGK15799.1 hypothetical protein EA25_16970 [Vibrio navarrensis]